MAGKSDGRLMIVIMGVVALFIGLSDLIIKSHFGKTYVEFFDTYIEGVGINGSNVDNFKIANDKVTNVSASGINIIISTIGGTYKIISNQKTAAEAYRYAQENLLNH